MLSPFPLAARSVGAMGSNFEGTSRSGSAGRFFSRLLGLTLSVSFALGFSLLTEMFALGFAVLAHALAFDFSARCCIAVFTIAPACWIRTVRIETTVTVGMMSSTVKGEP